MVGLALPRLKPGALSGRLKPALAFRVDGKLAAIGGRVRDAVVVALRVDGGIG